MTERPIFMPTELQWRHPDCPEIEISISTLYDTIEEADADFSIVVRIDCKEAHLNCDQATKLGHALLNACDVLKMQCVANAAARPLPAAPAADAKEGA